jgi:periplasmic divalent cation tolerance protein
VTDYCLLYVTTSSLDEARNLGRTVVEERLAACANVVGAIESFYHWEGKLETGSEEGLLILKTLGSKVPALTARLLVMHSYSCPAIVAIPILGGHQGFLDWIRDEVERPRSSS